MTKQPNDPGPSFRYLTIADLHLRESTLARGIQVLRRTGDVAAAQGAPIVLTGDFWDKRGVLVTRQVDAVLDELEIWRQKGVFAIFIPGNHDQSAMNGKIHGLRIFDPFPNIMVCTERVLDHKNRVAFIPWREDPQDQGEQFILDPPNTWTIFAHAEVRGAIANNGHEAAGRVTLNQIHAVARACYLGHYHARQKLGDRTWYLGNPFELNMGERGQPKGVAYITSESIEPQFFSFDDMPKHFRIDLREPVESPILKANDIVEIRATKAQLRDPEVKAWIEALPAKDVRPFPVAEEEPDAPPPMAMTVEAAVEAYAEGNEERAKLGAEILAEVKHLADAADPLGTTARVLGVTGHDFCKLGGKFSMGLDNQGAVMVQGPQGSGKTALVDAISWCLYDKTSPRKAGADAASLRGDDVVNDHADEVVVTVPIMVDGDRYEITRKKKRGKASRVRVRGPIARPDGINDDQAWVDALIGMPYALWRACVSLGQGPVSNFLTSTDKARKSLLSDAHGLGICVPARKVTKKRLDAVESRMTDLARQKAGIESVISHMEDQDFSADAQKWEEQREERAKEAEETIDQSEDAILEADRQLANVDDINAQLDEVEDEIIKLERRTLEGPGGEKKRSELMRQIGAAESERSVIERDKAQLAAKLSQLVGSAQGKGHGICPTCNQKWDRAGVDHHVAEIENKLKSMDFEISNLTTRVSNYQMELEGLTGNAAGQQEQLRKSLEEKRGRRDKLAKAKGLLDRVATNRAEAERRKAHAEKTLSELKRETNPFAARAEAHEEELQRKRDELEDVWSDLEEENHRAELLRFWVDGFGQNGLPVVVMRAVVGDLEATANEFLSQLTHGRVWSELSLADDSLDILFREYDSEGMVWRERRYEQLSGGQRRCAELAFSPLGLSEMLFRRLRCKVPLLIIDELTTHLDAEAKAIACDILHNLDRETVVVIDHDPTVQGEFDVVYNVDDLVRQ